MCEGALRTPAFTYALQNSKRCKEHKEPDARKRFTLLLQREMNRVRTRIEYRRFHIDRSPENEVVNLSSWLRLLLAIHGTPYGIVYEGQASFATPSAGG